MRITLCRTDQDENRTLGSIKVGDRVIHTVERPWLDNKPGESCVPDGFYYLEPHIGGRFTDTWALVGETVSHYEDPNLERFAVLFHAGNTANDVIGCIAPGIEKTDDGVLRSREAMEHLRDYLGADGPHFLTIKTRLLKK